MMRIEIRLVVVVAVLYGGLGIAAAEQPGAVIQGSPDTVIGGQPAARAGDGTTSGAPIVEGSRDVFINGKPAAISGGRTGCGGVIVGGSANVFINGKPMAQAGSPTTECPGR